MPAVKAVLAFRTVRGKLVGIGVAYAAILAYTVLMQFTRSLAAIRDPVASSGGMWAAGDEMLAWYSFALFLVPTFFLLLLGRQYEPAYLKYSKVVFWLSLTAPLCLALVLLGNAVHLPQVTEEFLWRNWRAPFVLIVVAMSRFLAHSIGAKRLLTRALLIEGGTLAIFATMLLSPAR